MVSRHAPSTVELFVTLPVQRHALCRFHRWRVTLRWMCRSSDRFSASSAATPFHRGTTLRIACDPTCNMTIDVNCRALGVMANHTCVAVVCSIVELRFRRKPTRHALVNMHERSTVELISSSAR
jgi:hypothetical protein